MRTTNAYASVARAILISAGMLGVVGCEQVEQVQDHFRDLTPHEAYLASLEQAGLGSTALGRAWERAGERAVEEPLTISLPFQEQGYIAPEEPGAMGYRVSIPRGRRLTAEVTLETQEGTRVFVDLFRVAADDEDPARPLISTDSVPGVFVHEPWRGGDFILRLQPELLRGGQYTVTLRLEAQLAFPVEGHGVRAIQSRFGVARDAGRRQHHGVDIFAPRGTPVIAAAAGRVNRVQVTNLGGKVVWLRDPVRNANLYYAHLDSQAVSTGQEVSPGDTLGFVGNTGNARTTPPHLHFGLYRRGEGPVDPFPFIDPPPGVPTELTADVGRLGSWVRIQSDGIRLRAAPSLRSDVLVELEQHTPVRVLAGSGDYFRVRLPDGSQGYVAARLTEPVDGPVAAEIVLSNRPVRVRPEGNAPIMITLPAGSEVPVLGRYGGYLYVRVPTGHGGWVGEALEG
ncbi:MAG: M23 family metallopeptidase [Gemmatimonadota bacterium]